MNNSQAFFFDARVQGWREAAAALPAGSLWFEIESTQDGVNQIRQALSGLNGLQAIHIVSHGSAGRVQLGSRELSSVTLVGYAEALGEIGASLAEGGDILLYGCSVGEGDAGAALVEAVYRLTGADVAASDDVTGAAGGDFELERLLGVVDGGVPIALWGLTQSLVLLTGSAGDDSIVGTSGNDTLEGLAGDDTLKGGQGINLLTGGLGADTFYFLANENSTNTITDLGDGADILRIDWAGGDTNTSVNATLAGPWTATADSYHGMHPSWKHGSVTLTTPGYAVNLAAITFGTGFTIVNTGSATALTGATPNDTLIGGTGNDTLAGGHGDDVLEGGAGQDTFVVTSESDYIIDLSAEDTVQVSAGAYAYAALSATYTAIATNLQLSGSLTLYSAGYGVNLSAVSAGTGGFRVYNTAGATTLVGSGLNDDLYGGAGNDTLTGGAGADTFFVNNSGLDTITDLGNGADTLSVSTERSVQATLVADWTATSASGNSGAATINANGYAVDLSAAGGNTGFTVLNTGSGAELKGSMYADTLNGGSGNDTLSGGPGNDSLTGGAGQDTFAFSHTNPGADTLTDFTYRDKIRIEGATFTTKPSAGTGANMALNTVQVTIGSSTTTVYVGTDSAPGADIVITLNGVYQAGQFFASGSDIFLNRAPMAANATATLSEDGSRQGSVSATDDDPVTYRVITQAANGTVSLAADGSYTYTPNANFAGSDSFTFLANDGLLDSNLGTVTLTVTPVNDPLTGTVTITGDAVQSQVLTASHTLADADGLGTVNYQWLAGGVPVAGATASTFTPGQAQVGQALSVRASYTDGQGFAESKTSSSTPAVQNVNDAPTLVSAVADASVAEDSAYTFTVPAGTFADLDPADTLSYTATRGDGTDLPAWLSFDAVTRTFAGTPLNADVGSLTLKLTALDPAGASASDQFVITVNNTNDAPTLQNPLVDRSVNEDSATSFLVPANAFRDVDVGDSLTYSATRTDGTALPTWLSFNPATRIFSGTPTNAQVGVLGVRVTATDASGSAISDEFNLTVVNVNDVPTVASPIADQTAQEDSAYGFTVPLTAFTDVDVGDSLSYTATQANGGALPNWLSFNAATRRLTGTPGNDQVGTITVRVTAKDVAQASASDDFTLTVQNVNDEPTLENLIPDQQATEDSAFSYTVPANTVSDIDPGEQLTWTATRLDGSALPGWLSFNPATRTLSGTPGDGDAGTVDLLITATDKGLASVSDDLTVTVANVNDAPTGAVTITGTPRQGQTLTAVSSLADPDGIPTSGPGALAYQWLADGQAISGATSSTLLLIQSLVGKAVNVRAFYTDTFGQAENVTSAATSAVANVNDAPTGAVSISSNATHRELLSASNTLVDVDGIPGSGAGAISYQWRANGSPISGATGSTFTLTPSQIGKAVTVTASYTDLGGTAESVTSPVATTTREFREFWHDALSRFAGPSQPQVLPPGQDWETLNTSYSTDLARWFGVPLEHGG
jgi:Ca2+-binding RTX toxin-like protein